MLTHMHFAQHVDLRRLTRALCLIAAVAGSALAGEQPHEEFVCTSSSSTRIVSIFNRDESAGDRKIAGCRVDYKKDGSTKTMWSSTTETAFCVAKALELVAKLRDGNFVCKPHSVESPDDADAREGPATNKPVQPSVTH
jgi:hypothetical protein